MQRIKSTGIQTFAHTPLNMGDKVAQDSVIFIKRDRLSSISLLDWETDYKIHPNGYVEFKFDINPDMVFYIINT